MTERPEGKIRFLVLHDYGMGGLWWWVWAVSAQDIMERLSEVEVVDDPDAIERASTWDLQEFDLDAKDLGPLQESRDEREQQRQQPGFGVLTGRPQVYLNYIDRAEDADDDETCLMELGADGRRLRQIVIAADGTATAETPDDWAFNSPFDLYTPEYAAMEITADEFETTWKRAHPAERADV